MIAINPFARITTDIFQSQTRQRPILEAWRGRTRADHLFLDVVWNVGVAITMDRVIIYVDQFPGAFQEKDRELSQSV